MAERLTVEEASATYESAMRNVLPAGDGVCAICKTFIAPGYTFCWRCNSQPNEVNAVVPITYSEHGGQMHHALRFYKNGVLQVRNYAMPRLAGILWRFVSSHEGCVARAAGVDSFDIVTTVPSSTPEADEQRSNLRTIVGWCEPVTGRYHRVLRATGEAQPGREYDASRYAATEPLHGAVLLIDDTWTAGGHAQSAAHALRQAGAQAVGLVVIGRHLQRSWQVTEDETSGDRFDALPRAFDWTTCTVHGA